MPSYLVKPGDVVKVCEKSRNLTVIHDSLKIRKGPVAPWLELDKAKLEGRILALPTKESIPVKINEQLIVEFYSR
jgi:small subunit ribosomal protein S4